METNRYQLGSDTIIEFSMPDRRLANKPVERWLFGRHVETALFGSAGSGALVKLLGRCATRLPLPRA